MRACIIRQSVPQVLASLRHPAPAAGLTMARMPATTIPMPWA
eukprot:CAMPEP_0178522862 /NCGR_PEP_ID=MMETSP0696-20121128/28771_1 /TAXON_ID=265572 /ORGANISM="Extubocellulus spinifer, Strain CCMP396" /LENGTH=41 /DNA_ID= /DNA_START= /DNA_END= /DNA_ORIENTATION=